MRVLTATCAALALAGCAAGPEYFTPTERVLGMSESGTPQAIYDITTKEGRYGEAKVSAPAAYKARGATYVLVAVELENTSNTPIKLDLGNTWLEDIRTDKVTYNRLAAQYYDGDPTVPAGDVRTIRLYFPMPPNIGPQAVDAFRLRWTVDAGPQLAYRQFTSFVEQEPYAYYSPYPYDVWGYGYGWASPYYGLGYDPWYYDPFFGPYVYSWPHPVGYPPVVVRDWRHYR